MATPPFDLAAACKHVSKRDRTLGRIIREVGPCGLEIAARQSPYEALAESIVYQQLSGRAAATIYARFCGLYGSRRCPRPQAVLDTEVARLRTAGLSRTKARALRDLAAKALDGTVPTRARTEKLSDEDLVERLTAVRGVGRWTVEMLLIFTPRPSRRLAGGRLRRAQGLRLRLRPRRVLPAQGAASARRGVASVPHRGELVPLARHRARLRRAARTPPAQALARRTSRRLPALHTVTPRPGSTAT